MDTTLASPPLNYGSLLYRDRQTEQQKYEEDAKWASSVEEDEFGQSNQDTIDRSRSLTSPDWAPLLPSEKMVRFSLLESSTRTFHTADDSVATTPARFSTSSTFASPHKYLSNKRSKDKRSYHQYTHALYPLSRTQLCCLLLVLLAGILILVPLSLYFDGNHRVSMQGSKWGYLTTRTTSYEAVNDKYFDYIIVGGGPSGIITATKLAKSFPTLQILLLESGTVSQASVLNNLAEAAAQKHERRRNIMTQQRFAGVSESTNLWQEEISDSTTSTVPLNKFDVPLLWSGVASSQGRRRRDFLDEEDDLNNATATTEDVLAVGSSSVFSSTHHWPIERTLLARALGGCGIHNAMVYVRALPTDLQRWNSSLWDYENDLLPHYMALERFEQNQEDINLQNESFWSGSEEHHKNRRQQQQSWRGLDGPITTMSALTAATASAVDAVAPLFVQSALTSGVTKLAEPGFNHPDPHARLGAGYYEFNIRNGMRHSIAQALLGQRRTTSDDTTIPSNLHIHTGVTVTRVLIIGWNSTRSSSSSSASHNSSVRAIGVEYVRTTMSPPKNQVGRYLLQQEDPNSEVILAAGAIMTPQLLFNSGIGKNGHVVDLPGVGQNLQDHPVVALSFAISPELALESASVYTVGDEMEDYTLAVTELDRLADVLANSIGNETEVAVRRRRRKIAGRLGTFGTAGFAAGAFLRSPYQSHNADKSPDIQLTVFPRQIEPHIIREAQAQNNTNSINWLRSHTMVVTVALLQPEARYQVKPALSLPQESTATKSFVGPRVDTVSPLAQMLDFRLPSIELRDGENEYLTELDVKRLAWGMEQVRTIQKAPPLSEYTREELVPGAPVQGEALHGFIRARSLPNSHWCGSTKMGRDDDPMAVVTEELRVRGVSGLRIVDSGVFPFVPNGNTHSTVCAVSSRAADLIAASRQEWLRRHHHYRR